MKTLAKNLLVAATLTGLSAGASALPIYIEVGIDGDIDADSRTDAFGALTLNSFQPTSTYFDQNKNGMIDLGEFVTDTGNATVGALNPISGTGASVEGFGGEWGLNVSWNLFGGAIVDGGGTVQGAQIVGGQVVISFNDFAGGNNYGALGVGPAVVIDVTGSTPLVGGGSLALELFGQVASAKSGFLFYNSGEDIADNVSAGITVPVFGSTEIFAGAFPGVPNGPPSAASQALYLAAFGVAYDPTIPTYARTTTLPSSNIEFVPAPATLGLLGLGLLGLRRQLRKRAA